MKIFLTILFCFFLLGCSFDNKSGIWENANTIKTKKNKDFDQFKTLSTQTEPFNKIIYPKVNFKISLEPPVSAIKWNDVHYKNSNNLENFFYKNLNEVIFKSKKISRHSINQNFLYENQIIINTDEKGNIFFYSILNNTLAFKYNFYQKNYKKIKKKLNIVSENNIIYISDNFGYVYAIDYIKQKLIWAKDYKIPFRSNIKILGEKLILADLNNSLYLIDKNNGDKLKVIPTEETLIKNNFVNSIVVAENFSYFLNTYGSLYAIDNNGRVRWFINLNRSLDINPSNLFNAKPIILYKEKLIISTDLYLYVINAKTGAEINKIAITSLTKPLASGNNLFLITNENLLVCIDLVKGQIIYSVDVNEKIAQFLNSKKKKFVDIKSIALLNNDIFLFLKNSYYLNLSSTAKIQNIKKLSNKINSFPIFINDSIIYFNTKNKIIILN